MYRFIGKSAHMLKKYRCAGCFCSRLLRFPHSIFRSSFSAPVPVGRMLPLRCIRFSCSIASWLLRPFAGCCVLVSCYAVCLLLLLGLRILLRFAASLFSRCSVLVKHSCFSVVRFAASMFTCFPCAFRISIS